MSEAGYWHKSEEIFMKMFLQETVRILAVFDFWQISDDFLMKHFHEMFHVKCQKYVRNLSEVVSLTEFWQISADLSDTFVTHFIILTVIGYIIDLNLIVFLHFFGTDRFLTVFWHISDSFLTDFSKWQFSDTFLTDFWQISKMYGTNILGEYQKSSSAAAGICLD